MLALLSYPVLVEPYFATQTQGYTWSAGYVAFVLFCGVTAWRGLSKMREDYAEAELPAVMQPESSAPGAGLMLIWILLAASASTLLLAVTNHLSQNVAAIPFLWVLPLAIYLLSFILCFDGHGWYRRYWFLGLMAVTLGGMAYAFFADSETIAHWQALLLFAIGLFACCMVCHGELARLKPDPRYLTLFYLMVSIGGAVGGILVGVLAPRLLSGYYELPLALVGCAALVLMVLRRDVSPEARWSLPAWIAAAVCVLGLTVYVGRELKTSFGGYRISVRNFYGGLRVSDSGIGASATRILTHGTINHGEQFLDPARRRVPTTYYGPHSGVAVGIRAVDTDGPAHLGVIGLGTGTLAVFGRPGDRVRYYEINPLVLNLARTEFSFLHDCLANLDVVLGDARLSLEREPAQDFSLLAVDAFSSDSIPVHLLTIEAFKLYFHHLKPNGVLAVHVSNKYLDLKPIVELAARALDKETRVIDTDDVDEIGEFGSTWVLVADHAFFLKPEIRDAGTKMMVRAGLRLWTDNYSNLFRILK
jgi:SAM-dependent methyltransferase